MKYTTLGKTGLKISRMGFGGIPIQRIDAEGTKKLMQQLAEEGVNYIDTARGYTVSEEYLGYALEGIRDKFVIATKSMARTREAMAADIEKSLGNLRTNHIDLYQVHNPSMEQLDTVIGEGGALEALLESALRSARMVSSSTILCGFGAATIRLYPPSASLVTKFPFSSSASASSSVRTRPIIFSGSAKASSYGSITVWVRMVATGL